MSTRCLIATEQPDGTFFTIYCHFDGYVENGVGEELFKNYKERWKVENLISDGDRRTLGYEEPEKELYNVSYKKYANFDTLKEQLETKDYIYIFNLNDEWIVISDVFRDGGGKTQTRKLADMF